MTRLLNGIDYSMPMNTKIVSVIDGKITRAEYNSTMGYFVEVTGKAGVKTRYLHLNKILVTKGARVTRGDAIALSGNSGRSSGPHLHYAFLRSSEAYLYFPGLKQESFCEGLLLPHQL